MRDADQHPGQGAAAAQAGPEDPADPVHRAGGPADHPRLRGDHRRAPGRAGGLRPRPHPGEPRAGATRSPRSTYFRQVAERRVERPARPRGSTAAGRGSRSTIPSGFAADRAAGRPADGPARGRRLRRHGRHPRPVLRRRACSSTWPRAEGVRLPLDLRPQVLLQPGPPEPVLHGARGAGHDHHGDDHDAVLDGDGARDRARHHGAAPGDAAQPGRDHRRQARALRPGRYGRDPHRAAGGAVLVPGAAARLVRRAGCADAAVHALHPRPRPAGLDPRPGPSSRR